MEVLEIQLAVVLWADKSVRKKRERDERYDFKFKCHSNRQRKIKYNFFLSRKRRQMAPNVKKTFSTEEILVIE